MFLSHPEKNHWSFELFLFCKMFCLYAFLPLLFCFLVCICWCLKQWYICVFMCVCMCVRICALPQGVLYVNGVQNIIGDMDGAFCLIAWWLHVCLKNHNQGHLITCLSYENHSILLISWHKPHLNFLSQIHSCVLCDGTRWTVGFSQH